MSDTKEKKPKKKTVKARKSNASEPVKNIKDITSSESVKIFNRKKVTILLVLVLTLLFFLLLINKTFFRTEYQNHKFKIKIPAFAYFVKDDGSEVTLITLRKSKNVRRYFDEYLSNLDNYDYYSCSDGKTLYYNEKNNNVIYSITVDKKFALKTIKIKYDIKDSKEVCEINEIEE